jgi:hypothetical protein
MDELDLISEVETCVYEIHINSYQVCSVPYFRKTPNNFQISCSPVVTASVYDKYVEKKAAHELEKAEKELKKQQDEKILSATLPDEHDLGGITSSPPPPSDTKVDEIDDDDDDDDIEANYLDGHMIDDMKKQIDAYEKSFKVTMDTLNLIIVTIESQQETTVNVENGEIESTDKMKNFGDELRVEIEKGKAIVRELRENVKEFDSIVDKIKKEK